MSFCSLWVATGSVRSASWTECRRWPRPPSSGRAESHSLMPPSSRWHTRWPQPPPRQCQPLSAGWVLVSQQAQSSCWPRQEVLIWNARRGRLVRRFLKAKPEEIFPHSWISLVHPAQGRTSGAAFPLHRTVKGKVGVCSNERSSFKHLQHYSLFQDLSYENVKKKYLKLLSVPFFFFYLLLVSRSAALSIHIRTTT